MKKLIIVAMALALASCGKQIEVIPAPPGKIVTVEVPIPVPCEIEQIAQPDYPAQRARNGNNIFDLAKIIAADRKVKQGEIAELRAANESPCK